MDLLEELLGRGRRRRRESVGEEIGDTVRGISRWIVGCGCLLLGAVVAVIVLVVAGVISFGNQGVMVFVVGAMIIVAIASLIRSGLEH